MRAPPIRWMFFTGLAIAALVLLVARQKPTRHDTMDNQNYRAGLQATQLSLQERLRSGSPEEKEAIERFKSLYSDLTVDRVRHELRGVYAEQIYFNDTLKTIRSVDQLESYLLHTANAVETTRVVVEDVSSSDGEYYFRWSMEIRFKKLAGSRPTRSLGMTHVRFNRSGRIVFHQDYWDSATGLFQHIDGLGWLLRVIKSRL